MRIRVNAFPEYNTPAPGKAIGRWGCYRRGYPVVYKGMFAVYLSLDVPPPGPAGRYARAYARAYGRECLLALPSLGDAWYVHSAALGDVRPIPEGMLYSGPMTVTLDGLDRY